MRFRGRRFWHETITLAQRAGGGGIDGTESWNTISDPMSAAVDTVSESQRVEMGLAANITYYFIRTEELPTQVGPETFAVNWRGKRYTIRTVSQQPGYDTELIVQEAYQS